MAVCPACGKNSIGALAKIFSDEMSCVRCASCGSYAYVPSWLWQLTNHSTPELLAYAAIVAAPVSYLTHSLVPIAGVLAIAITYAILRVRFARMIAVPEGEAQSRLRWGLVCIGIGAVIILAAFFVQVIR